MDVFPCLVFIFVEPRKSGELQLDAQTDRFDRLPGHSAHKVAGCGPEPVGLLTPEPVAAKAGNTWGPEVPPILSDHSNERAPETNTELPGALIQGAWAVKLISPRYPEMVLAKCFWGRPGVPMPHNHTCLGNSLLCWPSRQKQFVFLKMCVVFGLGTPGLQRRLGQQTIPGSL